MPGRPQLSATHPPIPQPQVVEHPRNLTLEVLQALGHPVRLELIAVIAARGPICSCHLEGLVGQSQPQISKHIATLRRAGLVDSRRDGRWVYYTVSEETLDAARGFLDQVRDSLHRPHVADDCGDGTARSA